MLSERAAWECKNEKNKANVRWLLILVVAAYLTYLLRTGKAEEVGANHLFHWTFIAALAGAMIALNLGFSIYLALASAGRAPMAPAFKYLTMLTDFVAVSLTLIPTGGDESKFYVVYFIIIVSNSLRYGMRLALAGLFMFNLCYVAVLAYQHFPEFRTTNLHAEILKVAGFWIVGLYTGYVARRFSILQGEVERYERLVKKLMQPKNAPD